MKRDRINIYGIITIILLVFASLTSCNETSDLGLELLPTDDLIDIRGKVIKDDISAYTSFTEYVRTDETTTSLLGSINDPVFGTTNINFASQFRLIEFPDFGVNPSVDSVKLYLYYSGIYGDTITPQKFKVYELESGLDVDASYTQDVDLKSMASAQLLGEVDYTPKVEIDSASSEILYQLITIPIDNSLGEKLLAADSLDMVSNDAFLEYFKGLLIESESVTQDGGAILGLEAAYSGNFLGSALLLYYSNDSTEKFDNDTSFVEPYLISSFSARVNSIEHDYSGTSFIENIDSEVSEDSLIYVQATGGLKAKILIEELSSWVDSANIAINKAEIIFQVDTVLSQVDLFPPPARLYFRYIDASNAEQWPEDYSFSSDFYGGVLDTDDYTYRFNITKHLQNIVEGELSNLGYYLTTGQIADRASRVILKGRGSSAGIKLIITYTKFNT